jgi:hypothetical protein
MCTFAPQKNEKSQLEMNIIARHSQNKVDIYKNSNFVNTNSHARTIFVLHTYNTHAVFTLLFFNDLQLMFLSYFREIRAQLKAF